MSQDCPHDRCNFFLIKGDAPCPGCGRSPRLWRNPAWLAIGAAGLAAALLAVAGWWLFGIVVLAAAGAGAAVLWQWLMTPRFDTLDARYQLAVDESAHWLTKWIELYRLNAQAADYLDDEQQLVEEAKAAAGDAAVEATTRRSAHAARYLENAFERLDSLGHRDAVRPGEASREAVAIIEHYLDTLWLDQATTNDALDRLAEHALTQRRAGLVSVASSVRVFEGLDTFGTLPPAVSGLDLDAHRARLRIERQLLREAPD